MAAYKTLGIFDYLGIQAMFFQSKVIGSQKFFFADRYWMIEVPSRRWGYRSFNRIDHLPSTVTIQGKTVAVDALTVVGTRVMLGNTVVGSVGSGGTLIGNAGGTLRTDTGSPLIGNAGGTLIGNAGGTLIGNAGGTLIGNAGGTLIGNAGGTVLSDRGAGVLGDRGAGVLGDRGAGFTRP